jgi:probable rRNA maturation factor
LVILRKRLTGQSAEALARFVVRARRAAGLRGVVNVLVTTDRELRALNRRFRRKDQPTDVLSFSPVAISPPDFAGDIAISGEMAARNARRLGHTITEELEVLVLHGILHLAGYDHERDNGKMARTERRLRLSLGLPGGLIERNPGSQSRRARRSKQ